KIRAILHIGLSNSHDAIVLSAFGCGAFKNPPTTIAKLFKEVLEEHPANMQNYKVVVFAIFDDERTRKEHNPRGNLVPFQEVFAGGPVLRPGQKEEEAPAGEESTSAKASRIVADTFARHRG
ncbi:hypothetical protein HK097_007896, partial [Rhizophlyctis rosea]